MKEYGISISDKESGGKVEIYFTPMTYADWCTYHSSDDKYDSASVRYLIKKYVVSSYLVRPEGREVFPSSDISTLGVSVIRETIDRMIAKSGFGDSEGFSDLLNELERNASTLMGAYDLFVYLNTNIETYLLLKDKSFHERAYVIATIERLTGISVRERFEMCIRNNIDLDITTPPAAYRPKRNGRNAGGIREDYSAREETSKSIDADTQDAISESRLSLQEALRRGKKNPTKNFDWARDNMDLDKFENEPGMEMDKPNR